MKTPAPSLLPLFRSRGQGELLGLLYSDIEREWSQGELARRTEVPQPTASRELARLVLSGLVRERRQGNVVLYQADDEHPFHRELARILAATFGVPAILTNAFATVDEIAALIVFGSWAARFAGLDGPPPRDIDVLLLGSPNRDAAYAAESWAGERVGRPVQLTIRSLASWEAESDPFIRTMRERPFTVLSSNDEARALGLMPTLGSPA